MDRETNDPYLREEHLLAEKKEKGRLLDKAGKRTGLAPRPCKKRRAVCDGAVLAVLVQLWTPFDHPCKQRGWCRCIGSRCRG
jgi:hypothetical protein